MGGGKSTHTYAEKLNGIRIQSSLFGAPIPIVYGTTRITSNLLWYDNFIATPHTETQSGGKGGGGSSSSTSYSYTADVIFGLCEGTNVGIGNIIKEKAMTTLTNEGLTFFNGARPQSAWGYLASKSPSKSLAYYGTCYLAGASISLGSDATLPNFSFELQGKNIVSGKVDANPADIIYDLLTNPYYGAGIDTSLMADIAQLHNYCQAYGILLSPAITEQNAVFEIVKRLLSACNSQIVYSEGKVKFIPYGETSLTANGATYTPSVTPIYDFTDDDYLDLETPVHITRSSPTDAFNSVKVEYYNRANNYNVETDESSDLANAELYGYRPQDVTALHDICDATVAHTVSQLLLNRVLYIRNKYVFIVSWKYCLLEPMDIVTITDEIMGLNKLQVRITEIVEDSEFKLTITAEDFPFGSATSTLYPKQETESYAQDYNVSGGNTNAPMILEAPDNLSTNLELWIGASGGSLWGGCDVFVSYDGSSYKQIGSITTPTKQGVIVTDSGSTMSVNMSMSFSSMLSGSAVDFSNNTPLYLVGNELISYRDATLTAQYQYDLHPLNRGVYSSTVITHTTGSLISQVNEAYVLKVPFQDTQIGQPIYVKMPSRNIYGSGIQSIEDVAPIVYIISGSANQSPLPDVTGLIDYYKGTTTYLKWDILADYRSPIDYEIRYGTTWDQGQILGRTLTTDFIPQNTGSYWIKAHYYYAPTGVDIYSINPVGIVVGGSSIISNVIATYDEKALGWTGAKSSGVVVVSGDLQLQSLSGTYEVPTGHIIDIGTSQQCNISISYVANGFNPSNTVDSWGLIDSLSDIDGAIGGFWNVIPQIAIAGNDGVFGVWKDFYPTDYVGRKFKIRLSMTSISSDVYVDISALTWSVDVPDRVDVGNNIAIASGGTSISYTRPFQATPNTQITIINAQQGDDAILTSQTASDFTVQVKNGGAGVARNINWLSQGY